MGSAAGTGKTTVTITLPERLLHISNTTEEADNTYNALVNAEEDVYRHKSRMWNRNHEKWETLPLGVEGNCRPCIQPELCNLYAMRGQPTSILCQRCPMLAECEEYGYRCQEAIEKATAKVVYAWGEAMVCDWINKDHIQRICSKDAVVIVEEVNPANLTQPRGFDRDMIFDLTERFRDGNTVKEFETLQALLNLISTAIDGKAFIDGLRNWIDGIEDIDDLDDKLQRYPVGYVFHDAPADANWAFVATMHYCGKEVTVPVVTHETGPDTPAFQVEPDQPILPNAWQHSFFGLGFLLKVGLADVNDPPRRFKSFLIDIRKFFHENTHENGNLDPETAPFTFEPKAQRFESHIKPTLNHRRVIYNTASDPDDLISEAYRDTGIEITRHTGKPPAWKSPLVFQLATGNYLPRQSLIAKVDGELQLKPRAQEMVDRFILPSIEAGLKTLVVAPKAFQKVEAVKSWAVTDMDAFMPPYNAMLINHHHAEGRNDFQDCDIAFVFHYEPNHHEIVAIAKRTFRNQETPLDFTREKRTVTVGGVSFEKNIYIDERVQAVYNRECRQRLMQSVMRLRPNIHEGKIIVFLTAEPIDIPVTPVPMALADGKGFDGDWQQFKAKLTRTAKERIEAGVSKSKAYRDAPSKAERDTDRDVEICRRFAGGQSKKQIANEMGIGQGTVKRVLEKQPF